MTDTNHKDAEVLNRLYNDKKLSMQEVADELGTTRSTVRYWMDKHDIDRRERKDALLISGGAPSMTVGSNGYENVTISQGGELSRVEIHRLVAIAEHGIDAVKDNHVHHKNEIPWDNRPNNLEVLSVKDHMEKHDHVTPDSVKLAAWSLYESTDLKYREVADRLGETTTNVSSYIKYVRDGKTNPQIEV